MASNLHSQLLFFGVDNKADQAETHKWAHS